MLAYVPDVCYSTVTKYFNLRLSFSVFFSSVKHVTFSPFRFDEKENVSNCIQLKTSVIKGIKNQLLEQFPDIEAWLNQIMPKKDPVKIVRWYDCSF